MAARPSPKGRTLSTLVQAKPASRRHHHHEHTPVSVQDLEWLLGISQALLGFFLGASDQGTRVECHGV